ncbi:MAG: sugar-phosphate isomerase, RpiB/LacA/LacB family [Myxococcaceae bacterium]|nr:sugar-phosphate isomerase, RpiB/LacA/LacB family [Myxococcaceae bacterium]
MKVSVAADHAGFVLKALVIEAVRAAGHEAFDLGTDTTDAVDYPDFARLLGEHLTSGQSERGVLLCGSGVGISIAANKIPGIRAAICHDSYSAHQGVEHDAMNVLVLGTRVIGSALASELVTTFVAAQFSSEVRHQRRYQKVLQLEREFADRYARRELDRSEP